MSVRLAGQRRRVQAAGSFGSRALYPLMALYPLRALDPLKALYPLKALDLLKALQLWGRRVGW